MDHSSFILRFNSWSYDNKLALWDRSRSGIDLANDRVCNWRSKVIVDKGKEYQATKIYLSTGYTMIAAMSEERWNKLYSEKLILLSNESIAPPSNN